MTRKLIPALVSLFACGCASAASITWDPVIVNTVESDILTGGTLMAAVNAAGVTSPVINGVTFSPGTPLGSNANGTFWTAGAGVNTTGSAGLDDLLNSHSYFSSATSFTLEGLTPGQAYNIQIIAVGDTRTCCDTRTQVFGDGVNFSGDLTRKDPASVVGHFVADSSAQTIAVQGGSVNGVDPGLSGYQLRAVPEPSGIALLSLSGLALLRRRR